ncbi:ABC transporter ATP-binding protein [Peribacillus cavernae]|uniref:ABC transporter ATP-binding protein n=1 Tax=Peribacillus cavernae TaxID=1674310 RepID=A0A433HPN4_9BACI|nr:ABC transporter ATP-binding protein [Peribacillus cavernae]MDQ0217239.1 NitT/TauT family transport system ATP-binding protein [Peribacillus cavernae]RUQ30291.1 ABC transporter ATP-binding protein [Peribacillus cavernae]
MAEPLMKVENLTKVYNSDAKEVVALKNIEFTVQKGEFISIVGPSGCGKTTLLEILSGLRLPTTGSVKIKGKAVTGPQRSIGIVFQEESTFPWRTVLENVEFGLQMQGMPKAEYRDKAHKMVELVGLKGFENSYPFELSGGMRQRVAIARTLVTQPEIVVMDEPFGALDEQTRLILGGELLKIVEQTKATVVLVTHSIQEAALLSDKIVVLSARPGKVKYLIKSTLPKPRDATALTTPEFAEITQKLWSSLEEESLTKRHDVDNDSSRVVGQ